jgi:hypothetical protein
VACWNGTAWENNGQNAILGASQGNITSLTVTTFNKFTFGSRGVNPLPIKLLSFYAKMNTSNTVDLTWSTASEINNNYFSIERSVDGVNFEKIMDVQAAGNSTTIINYKTIDENPVKGVSFYRLLQVDIDGNQEYSAVVSLYNYNLGSHSQFNVYPNPANARGFTVASSGNMDDVTQISLYNSNGIEVYSKAFVFTYGEMNLVVNPSNNLIPGIYILSCSNKRGINRQQLVVN